MMYEWHHIPSLNKSYSLKSGFLMTSKTALIASDNSPIH